ncbi:MAG: DUF362 domain-containing protein [Bacillota bacterium]
MGDHKHNEKKEKVDYYSKTGIGKKGIKKWYFPILGFLALIWFIIRVIPRPSRIRYPCQRRFAAPMAIGFLSWLGGITGIYTSISKIRYYFKKGRISYSGILVIFLLFFSGIALLYTNSSADISPNNPVGKGKGIYPGRVIWSHNPEATSWNGYDNYWWDDENTDITEVKGMFSQSLLKLTGRKDLNGAWEAIFTYYNENNNGIEKNYEKGEKIAIKLNLNTHSYYSEESNEIDLSPQVVEVLVESLVEKGKVREQDIILYDASRIMGDKIYKRIYAKYPEIIFVDNQGEEGRKKVEPDENAKIYFPEQDFNYYYLPKRIAEAKYLINLASMKKHSLAGVTFTAKNHFGSIYDVSSGIWTPRKLHQGVNTRNNKNGNPNPLINLMGHQDLGGKTVLYIIDSLYSAMNQQDNNPVRWSMKPFSGDWTSSLFMSQDGVALDSVAFDFLNEETNIPENSNNYLKEAAMADNPPSDIEYDPENNDNNLSSLGVYEHWNNPDDKKYSGNLGKNEGIELIKID